MTDTFDTIIIGAGPAGSATAHYLARRGIRALLLDKADFPRDKTCGDGLTPRALAVLKEMDLLEKLLGLGHRTDGLIIQAPNGRIVRGAFPLVGESLNYMLVVSRLVLDNLIRERALAGGAAFRQVRVKRVDPQPAGVRVTGEAQGKTVWLEAPVAVVATGANVKLLRQMELVHRPPAMILAARTYFEDIEALEDAAQFHFGGAPLPGYGWIFPLAATAANVGVGFFPRRWFKGRLPASPAKALDAFLNGAAVQSCLGPARRVGAVKGYPLRMDFTTAPTFAERVLLVGEAAGLVNPLTGEGIDYALESGRIAAGHIAALLGSGDFSSRNLVLYDDLLRRRFQGLFRFCEVVRMLFLNRICLNLLIRWAVYRPELKRKLIDIVLGSGGLPAP